jgi:hypothetical protein
MAPYLVIIAINAVFVGVAYGVVYPRFDPLTARRMVRADVVVTGAALLVAGALFAGQGLPFAIGPVALKWWGFSIVSMLVIEAPVFWAFCRMQGLSLSDLDAPARPPKD